MNVLSRTGRVWLLPLLAVMASFSAQAHLMVAQHGTLNITGDGVFMVLSLPVSAFSDVDDDDDGLLSAHEIQTHHSAILNQVGAALVLLVDGQAHALQSPLITPTFGHGNPSNKASQIVVTGRFNLHHPRQSLTFKAALFGAHEDEKSLNISVKRPAQSLRSQATLTPQHNRLELM